MSLHDSKRTALLYLTNCLPACNIDSIQHLSDGKLFCSQIETLFPEIKLLSLEKQKPIKSEESPNESLENIVKKEPEDGKIVETSKVKLEDATHTELGLEQIETAVLGNALFANWSEFPLVFVDNSQDYEYVDVISITESSEPVIDDGKCEQSLSEPVSSESNSESFAKPNIPSDDNKPVDESVKATGCDSDDISERYKLIKYFIDVRYQLKSETVIDFFGCKNRNEFELAKVAVFIFAEVVRHYINSNFAAIGTLQQLDNKVQQDLEQCFAFCFNDRSKISKVEIEKLLSNHGPYKISSSPNRNLVTPKRSCSSKYKRPLSPTLSPKETVYSDSPLKAYFESPIFTQSDIKIKEREIKRTMQLLYEEEVKSSNLQQRVQELEKQLKNIEKEKNELKARNREILETINPEKPKDCEYCKKLQNQLDDEKRHFEEYEKMVSGDKDQLLKNSENKLLELQTEFARRLSQVHYECNKTVKDNERLERETDDLKFEIHKKESEIEILDEKLKEMVTECEILKEKLAEAEAKVDESECPAIGECIGKYIEKENEKLLEEVKELRLKVHKKKKNFKDAMVQYMEENINSSVKNDSSLSGAKRVSSNKVCEEKKLQNLKDTEGVDKKCPVVCDNSTNKHYTRSKSCAGSHSTVPFIDSHNTSVTNDGIGSLWHQYNDSVSENKNTDELSKSDKFAKDIKKIEKVQKYISAQCGPNGSNGFVNSPAMKDVIIKSYMCLPETEESQVKFQNYNSVSKNILFGETQCNSNSEVYSKCVTCSKESDVQNCSGQSVNQDSTALQEKIEEVESWKEKYEVTSKLLESRQKEFEILRKKYSLLKHVHEDRLNKLRNLLLKYKKIEIELKTAQNAENDMKKSMEKEKYLFKMQIKELREKHNKIHSDISEYRAKNAALAEKNNELEQDLILYKTQNDQLSYHIKYLEKQIEDFNAHSKTVPSKDKMPENQVIPKIKVKRQEELRNLDNVLECFPKSEFNSPNKSEIFSWDKGNDESTLSGALHRRSLHGGFPYITDDEEAFLNHSSIAEINKGYESTNDQDTRRQELQRRNTMYAPQLQSCYPAEGPFMTPMNKNLSTRTKPIKAEPLSDEYQLQSDMPVAKKARLTGYFTKDQSNENLHTPLKTKRSFKTPSSLQRLFARKRRPIKPQAEK